MRANGKTRDNMRQRAARAAQERLIARDEDAHRRDEIKRSG